MSDVAVQLSDLTTIRVGGPARRFELATDTADLVELIRDADRRGEPVLVIGGGSNIVVGDQGFDGLVAKAGTGGLDIVGTSVRAEAGVEWDTVVAAALEAGLAGIEALSGIPGSVAGTPVQNVGAYGALTSDVLSALTVYDRTTGEIEEWGPERCGFGRHRDSVFKHTDRFLVLDVTYTLTKSTTSSRVRYQRLADRLGVALGEPAGTSEVRSAVLELRGESGMLLDAEDPDTCSVGSFFVHPVVRDVPAAASESPQFPDPDGIKLSAGWLIDHAGFKPGYGLDWGRGTVALSSKHALAITNRGRATAAEVMKFAAHIRAGVERRYGIRLRPECDLVNCELG